MSSPQVRPRVRQKDVLDELREVENAMRAGNADGDVNVFALPVTVTYGLLERCRREIERLRQRAF